MTVIGAATQDWFIFLRKEINVADGNIQKLSFWIFSLVGCWSWTSTQLHLYEREYMDPKSWVWCCPLQCSTRTTIIDSCIGYMHISFSVRDVSHTKRDIYIIPLTTYELTHMLWVEWCIYLIYKIPYHGIENQERMLRSRLDMAKQVRIFWLGPKNTRPGPHFFDSKQKEVDPWSEPFKKIFFG